MNRLKSAAIILAMFAYAYANFDSTVSAYEAGDYETAWREFLPLAEQGHAEAQFYLALMLDNGLGVKQSYEEAAKWYRRAAEAGHVSSQYNLGVMLDSGEGVAQDYQEAAIWYRKAAEAGHARAQNNLGVLYWNGHGVSQDPVEAYAWYLLASQQDNEVASRNVERRRQELSEAELAAAEARTEILAVIVDLRAQLGGLRMELDVARRGQEEALDKLDAMQRHVETSSAQLQAAQQERVTLERDLSEARGELERVQAERDEALAQVEVMLTQPETVSDLQAITAERDALQDELENLRAALAEMQAQLASLGVLQDPFIGTFSDGSLTVELHRENGTYTGRLHFQGRNFPIIEAQVDGNTLNGNFESGSSSFTFTATLEGDTLTLSTGNASYTLQQQVPDPPETLPDNMPASEAVSWSPELCRLYTQRWTQNHHDCVQLRQRMDTAVGMAMNCEHWLTLVQQLPCS